MCVQLEYLSDTSNNSLLYAPIKKMFVDNKYKCNNYKTYKIYYSNDKYSVYVILCTYCRCFKNFYIITSTELLCSQH